MKIANAKRDSHGDWKFDMKMGEEEVSYLVELAVTSLIKVGVIAVKETDDKQEFNIVNLQNAPSTQELQ